MTSSDIENNVTLPLKIGQFFSHAICLDSSSIEFFAALVGDSNPLHHDKEAAKKSRFGGLIASGTQTSSMMSAMLASKLCNLCPSIGLEISFRFLKPVYADVEMIVRWKLISIKKNDRLGGDIVTFSGKLLTSAGIPLVSGSAVSLVQWERVYTKNGSSL